MPTTISGSTGVTFPAGGVGNTAGAAVGTTDTQTLTNKTLTTPNIDSAQVETVSGTAPLYMARAWVNFNGTGTVAIRASGNVTSITDNATADYTVNFTTAMPDINYATIGTTGTGANFQAPCTLNINRVQTSGSHVDPTTSAVRISIDPIGNGDSKYVNVVIFR